LLSWSWHGNRLEAAISRARYVLRIEAHEVLAWCELREIGAGRRRIEVGSYADVAAAKAACERHAAGLLAERGERGPVSVAIARLTPAEKRRRRREAMQRGQPVLVDVAELQDESARIDQALRAFADVIGEKS
jgi:hypothetical protein